MIWVLNVAGYHFKLPGSEIIIPFDNKIYKISNEIPESPQLRIVARKIIKPIPVKRTPGRPKKEDMIPVPEKSLKGKKISKIVRKKY